ncbi:MAG: hypothetical protein ACRDRL_26580 [Sciscionella sp.]
MREPAGGIAAVLLAGGAVVVVEAADVAGVLGMLAAVLPTGELEATLVTWALLGTGEAGAELSAAGWAAPPQAVRPSSSIPAAGSARTPVRDTPTLCQTR